MSNLSRTVVHTSNAPKAVGPYSQAVSVGQMVYTAGQVAIDPATNQFIGGDVARQTRQALSNLRAVLEAGGSGLDLVLKTTVFLTTMDHFALMNGAYAEFFPDAPPARTTIAVSELPLGALVEIECVAIKRG